MSTISRLDAVAERLGRPSTWGRAGARFVGFVAVIVGAGMLLAASVAPTTSLAATVVDSVEQRLMFGPPPASLGELPERSVVLDRDGRVLAVLHDIENRKRVPLDAVPLHVQRAVLATEDSAFFEHRGVNWRAIARAAVGNWRAGEVTSGASTITQQLVKNLVLHDTSRTLDRKLREASYATALELRMSKRQILTEYLNLAYFGHGVYGIGTAAEYYFGVEVGDLDLPQAALLAGLIRAPEVNDPIDHPRAARQRRDIVLAQMVDAGFVTPAWARRATGRPLGLDAPRRPPSGNSIFVTYVRELLKSEPALGATRRARARALLRGGLTIRTTLDRDVQRLADAAIRDVLPGPKGPQSAVTALDPRTGEILAIGTGPRRFGRGAGRTQVTPAVPGLGAGVGRQPGSAFKAFELVAALESGISPTFTYQAGARYRFTRTRCPSGYWPGNYADASMGLLDMSAATARSSNTYFARLADITGPDKLVEVAARMGVRAPLQGLCSTVLGSEEVHGLDLASGYGTLANNGVLCAPYAITEVTDRRGRTIVRRGPTCRRAVESGVARRVTQLLRGPLESGTAARNGPIGRPAAGKTGTTDDYGDAWFVGYTPQLSASAWVGHPGRVRELRDPRCPGGRVTGGCLPTMVWAKFMRRATAELELPTTDFRKPPPLPRGRVPDVVGRPLATAERLLRRVPLTAVERTVADHRPAGTVVAQAPEGGRRVTVGGAVVVAVSDGSIRLTRVPDLAGLTRSLAAARVRAAGLRPIVVDVPVLQPERAGQVVSQQPAAGVDTRGETVTVQVGRAAPGVAPPRARAGGDRRRRDARDRERPRR